MRNRRAKDNESDSRRERILKAIDELRANGSDASLELAKSLESDMDDANSVLGWWAGPGGK